MLIITFAVQAANQRKDIYCSFIILIYTHLLEALQFTKWVLQGFAQSHHSTVTNLV